MTIVAILGADTPKMQAIEGLLTEAGVPFVYGLHGGERVRSATAYRTDGLSGDIPPGAEVWVVEGDGPAVNALREAGHTVVTIDHHRPGDPGYGRPPAEFLPASSIGQILVLMRKMLPEHWPRAEMGSGFGEDEAYLSGPYGEERTSPRKTYFDRDDFDDVGAPWSLGSMDEGDWYSLEDDGTWWLHWGEGGCDVGSYYYAAAIPHDLVLAAAADYCLAAAIRGECPGVDPDDLMRWREDQ